jgi:hypothetical protein
MPHPPIISPQSVGTRLGRAVVQRGALGFCWSEESRRKTKSALAACQRRRRTAHRMPWQPWYATARERSADALTREPLLSAVIVSGLSGHHLSRSPCLRVRPMALCACPSGLEDLAPAAEARGCPIHGKQLLPQTTVEAPGCQKARLLGGHFKPAISA